MYIIFWEFKLLSSCILCNSRSFQFLWSISFIIIIKLLVRMQSHLPQQAVIVGKASILTKLPDHTEVHTTSPIAAGLPVLEVVIILIRFFFYPSRIFIYIILWFKIRRLDEEKILTREDKDALKIALYSTVT